MARGPLTITALVAAGAMLTPASALAAPEAQIDALFAAPCPAYEVISSTNRWSGEEVARGLDNRFVVSDFPAEERQLAGDIDWTQDPFGSSDWRGDLHSLKWLDLLLFVYNRGTADPGSAAIERARDIALDWTADNPPPPPLGTGTYADNKPWSPKVAADRGPYIAFIARTMACREAARPGEDGFLSRSQASMLLDSLALHGAYLSDQANFRESNHGLFVDAGLLLLSKYLPFTSGAARFGETARNRFPLTLMGRTNAAEALWLEHSAGYQRLATNTARDFIRFSASEDAALLDLQARMEDTTGWFVLPDDHVVQFGDTYRKPAPEWAREAAADDSGMRVFREGGYAIVKRPDRDAYLGVAASFHNQTHKHSDDLSFELYERGRRIVSDTGLFHKDDGEERDFEVEARAHSVLQVDDLDFPRDARSAYGSGIRATGTGHGFYLIQATNPLLEAQGVRHERTFLYRPGSLLIVVDRVLSETEHSFRRWFHFGPDLTLDRRGGRIGFRGGRVAGTLTDADPRSKVETFFGEADPLQGLTFPSFRTSVQRPTVSLRTGPREAATAIATFSLQRRKAFRVSEARGAGLVLSVDPLGAKRPTTFTLIEEAGVLSLERTRARGGKSG